MPYQATPSNVLRRHELSLQARGHWFEPSCAHQEVFTFRWGQLAALRQAQREQRARSHPPATPGSDARHKPRSGRPPIFPFPDRVVATVLHLRLSLPDDTLAHLFGTSRSTMRRALDETRHLLDQHGHRIEPVTAPPDLPAHIPPYVTQAATSPGESKIKKAS